MSRAYRVLCVLLWAVVGLSHLANGFYLPGVAPRDYSIGEPLDIKVVKLDSVKTQLPYDYYSLPFCRPAKITEDTEALGEVLGGDNIENSPYDVSMKVQESCKVLCKKEYSPEQLTQFVDRIKEDYRVNWLVDNLPASTVMWKQNPDAAADDVDAFVPVYKKGYALGYVGGGEFAGVGEVEGEIYINNHIAIKIKFHEHVDDKGVSSGARVVGFEVQPYSVRHRIEGAWTGTSKSLNTCDSETETDQNTKPQSVDPTKGTTEIVWTYDVQWEVSDVKWASRWDVYLQSGNEEQIHWFAIVNSTMVVLFLTGMVAIILIRALRKDLTGYNDDGITEESQQIDTGWKLVHGDVFRPPEYPGIFSVLVGTGLQLLAMTLVTLFFAMLGFLSPANRGGLMTAFLMIFVFFGSFAGYYSSKTYRLFQQQNWKSNALFTAISFPSMAFGIFFILNLFIWNEKSSGAVPFTTMLAMVGMWFGISVPLVFAGAVLAQRSKPQVVPTKVNLITRLVMQERPVYSKFWFQIVLGGVLPFAACFIEIFFILTSLWLHQYYSMFTCLFLGFLIMVITCAEISIVMVYLQLTHEDHRWHWRSFLVSASAAGYMFLYSIVYFFTKLEITKLGSIALYLGYNFLACAGFALLTGTIGYIATNYFVWTIYGALKID